MLRRLLVLGLLAGAIAGLLAFLFALTVGEPQLDRALAFESQSMQRHLHPVESEVVSRSIQSGIGLFVAVVVFGTALGGLFAVAFAFVHGRFGDLSPRATSALLAAAAFFAIALVPAIKYPANPPSVGSPDTIAERTTLYLVTILVTIAGMLFSAFIGSRFLTRLGTWNASLLGSSVLLLVLIIVHALLPAVGDIAQQFPADVLWNFRIASIGIHLILWTTIGIVFGELVERVLFPPSSRH
ncbi:CbtA family protein [Ferrovibrio sp.]|uniref:CbtA family protein n=1 Tax=Ferrovibrio sp. TaxID=1917215 RepID=UPI00351382D9